MPSRVKSKSLFLRPRLWKGSDRHSVPAGHIRAEGKIKNVNTVEDFKNMDKAAMLQTAAKQVSLILPDH